MGKKAKVMHSLVIALAILFCGVMLTLPAGVQAQPKVVSVEGVSYNVGSSMEDNLKALAGKKVAVTLASGKTITGMVKEVGGHLVHLEKLEGKEYFDALIRIDNISAIDTKFRGDQR